MLRIAVLISGGGSNLQSLIDYSQDNSEAGFQVDAVISDRKAVGTDRAEKANIANWTLDRKIGPQALAEELDKILSDKVDYIVLAGFLSILHSSFIEKWSEKIINIHPSLLPKFGGKGMYGMNVHRAVMEAGENESGCTVHLVDKGIDTGKIIGQMKLSVNQQWDPETLQREVLKLEHQLLPQTIKELSKALGSGE